MGPPIEAVVWVNGEEHPLGQPLVLEQLLGRLGVAGRSVAVEVNLKLVPRQEHARYLVRPGDRLEVVTLAGGG